MSIRRGDRVRHVPTGFEGMVVVIDGDEAKVQPMFSTVFRAEWLPVSELEVVTGRAQRPAAPRLRDVSKPKEGEVSSG